jgi:hypothetical protein
VFPKRLEVMQWQFAMKCKGCFSRPIISDVSTATPAYGSAFAVMLNFSGGAPVTISRVVFNRVGGITHSTHFDQRQVSISLGC